MAVRELVRGRIEVTGPITAEALKDFFRLTLSDIQGASWLWKARVSSCGESSVQTPSKLSVATGGCWRGFTGSLSTSFGPRLSPFRSPCFSVSCWPGKKWIRNIAPLVSRVAAVLELLDGCELAAAAWEPEVLALRVKDYTPTFLDQLCFNRSDRLGPLNLPPTRSGRLSGPIGQVLSPCLRVAICTIGSRFPQSRLLPNFHRCGANA